MLLSRENPTSIVEVNDWDGAATVLKAERSCTAIRPERRASYLRHKNRIDLKAPMCAEGIQSTKLRDCQYSLEIRFRTETAEA